MSKVVMVGWLMPRLVKKPPSWLNSSLRLPSRQGGFPVTAIFKVVVA
ncbi:TPA: hypothetical protein OPV32_002947 [Pseudomonas aeruginosa]|nr:hypothetical protein [Pseudomonas aeruginosa]MDN3765566.1 hypothetical protein [Pseudomonas aeruginosa]HCR9778821.1 hypothetical protein [Pseudomonas aeruginosa]